MWCIFEIPGRCGSFRQPPPPPPPGPPPPLSPPLKQRSPPPPPEAQTFVWLMAVLVVKNASGRVCVCVCVCVCVHIARFASSACVCTLQWEGGAVSCLRFCSKLHCAGECTLFCFNAIFSERCCTGAQSPLACASRGGTALSKRGMSVWLLCSLSSACAPGGWVGVTNARKSSTVFARERGACARPGPLALPDSNFFCLPITKQTGCFHCGGEGQGGGALP